MINHTVAVICAIILLILILYTQGRKLMAIWRKRAEKCEACGRTVTERPVRMKIDDREAVFCCRHCADAYVKSRPNRETDEHGRE